MIQCLPRVGGWRKRPLKLEVRPEPHKEDTLALLRHTVIRSVEQPSLHAVSDVRLCFLLVCLPQTGPMPGNRFVFVPHNGWVLHLQENISKIVCESFSQ